DRCKSERAEIFRTCNDVIDAEDQRVRSDDVHAISFRQFVPPGMPARPLNIPAAQSASWARRISSPVGLQLDRRKIGVADAGNGMEKAVLPLASRPDLVEHLPRKGELAKNGLERVLTQVIRNGHPIH